MAQTIEIKKTVEEIAAEEIRALVKIGADILAFDGVYNPISGKHASLFSEMLLSGSSGMVATYKQILQEGGKVQRGLNASRRWVVYNKRNDGSYFNLKYFTVMDLGKIGFKASSVSQDIQFSDYEGRNPVVLAYISAKTGRPIDMRAKKKIIDSLLKMSDDDMIAYIIDADMTVRELVKTEKAEPVKATKKTAKKPVPKAIANKRSSIQVSLSLEDRVAALEQGINAILKAVQ